MPSAEKIWSQLLWIYRWTHRNTIETATLLLFEMSGCTIELENVKEIAKQHFFVENFSNVIAYSAAENVIEWIIRVNGSTIFGIARQCIIEKYNYRISVQRTVKTSPTTNRISNPKSRGRHSTSNYMTHDILIQALLLINELACVNYKCF